MFACRIVRGPSSNSDSTIDCTQRLVNCSMFMADWRRASSCQSTSDRFKLYFPPIWAKGNAVGRPNANVSVRPYWHADRGGRRWSNRTAAASVAVSVDAGRSTGALPVRWWRRVLRLEGRRGGTKTSVEPGDVCATPQSPAKWQTCVLNTTSNDLCIG